MSIKKYTIYCEICGFLRITDGSQSEDKALKEIKRGKIQRNLPTLNEEGKTEESKFLTQPKMVKCPKCGRGIRIRKARKNEEDNAS